MRRKLSKKQIGAMGLAALMSAQTPIMASETETATEQVLQETQTEEQVQLEVQSDAANEELQTEEVLETQTETESETTTLEVEAEPASFEESANQSDGISMQALTEGWNVDENGRRMYVKNGNPIKRPYRAN